MSWHSRKKPGIGCRSPYALRRIYLEEGKAVFDKDDSNDALYLVVTGTVHHSFPRCRKSSAAVELGVGAIFEQAGLYSGSVRLDTTVVPPMPYSTASSWFDLC